jgi:hypothetical protein
MDNAAAILAREVDKLRRRLAEAQLRKAASPFWRSKGSGRS